MHRSASSHNFHVFSTDLQLMMYASTPAAQPPPSCEIMVGVWPYCSPHAACNISVGHWCCRFSSNQWSTRRARGYARQKTIARWGSALTSTTALFMHSSKIQSQLTKAHTPKRWPHCHHQKQCFGSNSSWAVYDACADTQELIMNIAIIMVYLLQPIPYGSNGLGRPRWQCHNGHSSSVMQTLQFQR